MRNAVRPERTNDSSASPGSLGGEPSPLRVVTFHLNQVGDLLFSLPALLALRSGFPGARITAVVRPSLVGLLEITGLVDDILERPRRGWIAKIRLIRRLRRAAFQVAVSFSQAEECVLLARLTGAAVRAGFSGGRFAGWFTVQAEKIGPPSTGNNLRLVSALGCPAVQDTYVGLITPSDGDRADAEQLLVRVGVQMDRPIAVISPATSKRRTIKEWRTDRFAAVADYMAKHKGAQVVLVGAEPDHALREAVRGPVADLSGQTTLRQLAAVLERAALFIGVDSGVMHMAAALRTPCVAIFGPSDPTLTGPQGKGHQVVRLGLSCSPCFGKTCPYNRECMENLQPEKVIEAIDLVSPV